MTPRQLQYLDKKYKQRMEREEFYSAQVAATSANYSMCRPKEPLKPADFMPSQHGRSAQSGTDESVARQINAALQPRSIPKMKE